MVAGRRLIVLGNVNLDLGMGPVEAWPDPGTEVVGRRAFFRPGGSAGNAALAAAALGLSVELHAGVGDDALGRWLVAELEAGGVECSHVSYHPAQTGFSFAATHPGGERTFFSFAGHLEMETLDGGRLDAPPGSVVLACGYYLLPQWRNGQLARFFAACRARGLVTCLDVGWPTDGHFDPDELTPLLEQTYLFLPNRAEALALTGEETPEHALPRLARRVAVPVIKDGANGAWAFDGRALHSPALAVRPEDTVGAGDVFNAALIQALFFEGWSLARSLEYANAAAGLAIRSSPRRYPTAGDVHAHLARHAR